MDGGRKGYEFDGPRGKVSLLDLFEGRRQLIVYRAFFEPGVFGWPDHACRGCSLGADQVAPPRASERARHHARLCLARAAGRHRAPEGADGLGHALVHDHRQLRRRLRRRRMARPQRVHPRRRPRLPHLLRQQPRRRGDGHASGATSTSRRSAVRRRGKTRPRAIPRRRPTSGGTGTTTTRPKPLRTQSGSRSPTPEKPPSASKPPTRKASQAQPEERRATVIRACAWRWKLQSGNHPPPGGLGRRGSGRARCIGAAGPSGTPPAGASGDPQPGSRLAAGTSAAIISKPCSRVFSPKPCSTRIKPGRRLSICSKCLHGGAASWDRRTRIP